MDFTGTTGRRLPREALDPRFGASAITPIALNRDLPRLIVTPAARGFFALESSSDRS
jgi:hypothetical protein